MYNNPILRQLFLLNRATTASPVSLSGAFVRTRVVYRVLSLSSKLLPLQTMCGMFQYDVRWPTVAVTVTKHYMEG